MINRYGHWLDTNEIVPIDESTCEVVFRYYLEASSGRLDDKEWIEASLASSHQVQLEDETLCNAVQIGLASDAYSTGRYVPKFEMPMFHFHKLLSGCYQSFLK